MKKFIIKFPAWAEGDELPGYAPFRRKKIRQALRSSPHARYSLCRIIDVIINAIDASRRDLRREN